MLTQESAGVQMKCSQLYVACRYRSGGASAVVGESRFCLVLALWGADLLQPLPNRDMVNKC